MKKYIISFVVLCSVFTALAQIKMMTVHQKNGQPMMIPVENIDSITFADVTAPAEIRMLLWANTPSVPSKRTISISMLQRAIFLQPNWKR